jgi:biotin-dependent carboxylase-like uncharacterized protein
MVTLKVFQAGPYISVQDRGRPGFLRAGIAEGGAIDQCALEEGRLLVGNLHGCAALEMLGLGGRFEAGSEALCMALTGAVFSAKLDDKIIPPYTSFSLQSGQVLEIGAAISGNYGYLSVAGGIDTNLVLASRSTHIRAAFGGYEGRCLKSGDVLPVGIVRNSTCDLALPLPEQNRSKDIRILWAAQADLFGEDELRRFIETKFEISHELDRMGVRLKSDGEPVHSKEGLVVLSGAIAAGDIQVPGNGRPIVLLADRQPTGGYPRIATIIAADLADFAQRPAGSKIFFKPVSEQQAVDALVKRTDRMKNLLDRLEKISSTAISSDTLLSENLISGVVSSGDKSRDSQ